MAETAIDDPVLRLLKAELQREYGDRLDRIVLFGSRARGDHREDSDYDVAVFLKSYDRWLDEVMRLARIDVGIFYQTGGWISAKPFLPHEYAARTGFMGEVRRDGRLI